MASRNTFYDIAANQRIYKRAESSPVDYEANAMHMGWQKRLNAMKRRLAAFFKFTAEETLPGSGSLKFAHNRYSPGLMSPALITLTYPDNSFWNPKHISDFINHARNYAARHWGEKLRYVWVAETTKKGVIHYHVLVWLPRSKKLPKPDKQGWWPHGLSEISSVQKGVYNYLLKYISKGSDAMGLGLSSETKSGRRQAARMFGYGGLPPKARELISYQMLPAYIKDIFGCIPFGQKIERVKGGWEWKEGKVFVKSNWEGMWDEVEREMVYKYGVSWCALPDEKPDIFIPF